MSEPIGIKEFARVILEVEVKLIDAPQTEISPRRVIRPQRAVLRYSRPSKGSQVEWAGGILHGAILTPSGLFVRTDGVYGMGPSSAPEWLHPLIQQYWPTALESYGGQG